MSKTKTAIFSTSLLNILMNAGIVPVMSILASEIPNADPSALKFTLSISSIFFVIFGLSASFLERLLPRKKLLLIGLLLYAAGGMGGGLVNSVSGLLISRAFLGIGGGICIPLTNAYIADLFDGEERRKTIGQSLFAANLGAMVLPLIGTWLAQLNWRLGFLIYLVAIIAFVLSWKFLPDLQFDLEPSGKPRSLFYFSGPVVWAAAIYFFVMVLFAALPSNFSLFVAEEKLGSASLAAWHSTFSTLSAMVISPLFPQIYQMLKKWMIPIGFLICGAGFFVLAQLNGIWASFAGNVLIGASLGLLHPLFPYMAMQGTPREHSSSAQALVTSGFRLGVFVSPFFFLLANSILDFSSIRGEFLLSALLFGIGVIVSGAVLSNLVRRPVNTSRI